MLGITLAFFDRLLEKLFLDAAKEKIKDHLDRRSVERTVSRCSEAPAQALESFFRNENLDKDKVAAILDEVQQAISSANVDARMLASASLDGQKLLEMILLKYPLSQRIKEQELEWPFRMALQISADTLCSVGPRFHEWEREAWRRSFEAFDKLLQNQEMILSSVGSGGEGSLDHRFEHTYRAHVLRRLAQIDSSTFRMSSSVLLDLSTVFVQPDVLVRVPSFRDGQEGETKPGVTVISLEEARKEVLLPAQGEDEPLRIQAEEFISKHKRCAIVGLPGCGKTTLLQHTLLTSARGEGSFGADNGTIPVFLRARQLDPDKLPGADDLLQVAEGKVFAGACSGFLKRQLEAGRVLLLIDGLDEVVADRRGDLMRWISDLVELYPDSRYVVSSRPHGYRSRSLQRLHFSEAMLCEFNTDQIREFARCWTQAVAMAEGASREEADQESSRYAEALIERAERNPYVRRIATNPLLLSTLCLVQRYEGGELPNRRVTLYQRCVEGLLFHWDNKRGLPPSMLGTLSLERKMMLLRRLALEMQIQGVAEVAEDEVEQSFTNSLKEVGEQTDPRAILDNIHDRSGLLLERRPRIYGFSHLTFQEYLAALSINHADYRTYGRLFLFSKRSDPEWSEVVTLYAGIAPRNSVETLLRELIAGQKPESVLLGGECLVAAQDVGLSTKEEVIGALLSLPDAVSLQNILESLDERVVMHHAIAALGNLERVHALRYLGAKLPYESADPIHETAIGALCQTGKMIIEGKQRPARWDHAVSLILLLTRHSSAAEALGMLADTASKRRRLGRRAGVLLGLWSRELWTRPFSGQERQEGFLPGVLKYLDEPSATEEQSHLCKFITVAASEKVAGNLRKGRSWRHGLFELPPKVLIERLEYLAQHGDTSVRGLAARAAVSLSKVISSEMISAAQDKGVALHNGS